MFSKGASKAVLLFGMIGLMLALALVVGWNAFGDQEANPNGAIVSQKGSADTLQGSGSAPASAKLEQAAVPSIDKGKEISTDSRPAREGMEQFLTIAFIEESGSPVEGEIWLLARTASLEERLRSGRFASTYLFEDSLLAQDRTVGGQVKIPVVSSWLETPLIAFVVAPGFSPRAVVVKPGPKTTQVQLQPIESISVYVVDTDGKAVTNTACWLTPVFTDWRAGPEDWLERLALRGYMEQAFTDAHGRATFFTCYPDSGNSIKVYPEPPLALAAASFCKAGIDVRLSCAFGFAVSGRISDAETGEPIAGAFAIMNEDGIDGTRTINSQITETNGLYRQEALPAGAAVFSIIAKADGYAMQRKRIYAPQASSSYEFDFLLQPTEGLELQLRTSWGDPILNSIVQLRLGRNNLETDFQSTNEKGIVHFPAELQRETPYECLILVGSNFWALPNLTVQAGEAQVVVRDLSQVNTVTMPKDLPDGFVPASFEWTALANENQGTVVWNMDQPSPLLPSGAGCLAVMSSSGQRLEMLATLEEGVHEEIAFISYPARLVFEWTGEDVAYLSLRSNIAWDWFKMEEPIAPGRVELDLWQGTFSLMVEGEGGSVSLPALRLEAGLTDLGPLGWQDLAGVQGRVHDASNQPLAGVEVNLFSMEVGPSGFASTDEQGNFAIGGMSPGAYYLQVTGGKAYGGSVHEVQQEIFLAPHESQQGLDIQLEMNASNYLDGRVVQDPPAGAFAFSAAGGQAQLTDVLPAGNFLLPRPRASRWIGVGMQVRGRALFTMKKVEAGVESLLLDAPSIRHTLRIVDENGAPWVDARIYAYVAGASLGYFSLPDLDGNLALELSSQAEVNLQFRLPDGRAMVHSLSELLALQTLTIPRNPNFVQLELVDDMGNAIPGAAAMHYGVGDVFYGNGKGELALPTATPEKPYLLMAAGHLSVWSIVLHDQQVTLPTLFAGIHLNLPKNLFDTESKFVASWVRVRSLGLPANALSLDAFELSIEGHGVNLPPLPAGKIEVQVFDEEGNALGLRVLAIASTTTTLEY